MSESQSHRTHVAIALAIIYLVWGSSFIATKVMVTDEPPLLAAGLRFYVRRDAADGLCLVARRAANTFARRAAACARDGIPRGSLQQCLPRDRDAVRSIEHGGAPERDARALDRLARHLRPPPEAAFRNGPGGSPHRACGRAARAVAEGRISHRRLRLAVADPARLPQLVDRHLLPPQLRHAESAADVRRAADAGGRARAAACSRCQRRVVRNATGRRARSSPFSGSR